MTNPATVIVFVPGTTASELFFAEDLSPNPAWPYVLDPDTFAGTKVLMAKSLEHDMLSDIGGLVKFYPVSSTGGAGKSPCYEDLLDFMAGTKTFKRKLDTPFDTYTYPSDIPAATERLFYPVPYDWRLDNGYSAVSRLLPALNKVAEAFPDGNYDLYLLAHSNGGLVSRYLLEHVRPTDAPWWNNLRAFCTLATPHLGSPLAWIPVTHQDMIDNEPIEAINFVASVVDNTKFSSTFQLLPFGPDSADFIRGSADNSVVDIFPIVSEPDSRLRIDTQGTCLTSMQNLFNATVFQQALDLSKAPCPYYFYYGDGVNTLAGDDSKSTAAFSYTPGASTSEQVFAPLSKDNWPSLGDSVVPATSASARMPAGVTTVPFLTYTHGQMGGCDMQNADNAVVTFLTDVCHQTVSNAAASQAAE